MNSIYLYQFACFIFMLINALYLGGSSLHVKWENKRYEQSRWIIFLALIGLAIQYLIQMGFGFRTTGNDLGAIVNILIYTPCFSLIAMGIYNIEATHSNRKKITTVCALFYAAILTTFCLGFLRTGNLHIGNWLYIMLSLFTMSVAYCIFMISKEVKRREKKLETLTATDMLPFVRYAHASLFTLFLASFAMPFAILSSKLLFIIGPFALLAVFFFNLNFIALGNSYTPTEEFLYTEDEKEEQENVYGGNEQEEEKEVQVSSLSAEREEFIKTTLENWCKEKGYKDCSVNMLTLSHSLCISKNELKAYFDSCQNITFRLWLSDIRFNAAKKMMMDFPNYSNDVISAECGFSSRSHLYRIFKVREGCTPTEWRDSQQSLS